MSDTIGILVRDPYDHIADNDVAGWSEGFRAENFMRGVECGAEKLGRYDHLAVQGEIYGTATGFVYFIAAGEPDIQFVKVGFTSGDPRKRLKALQTGCPHRLRILGFVMGNETYERELHQVLCDDNTAGEWFAWSPYVQKIIMDQLEAERG
jgi:hypothetical protein